MGSGFWVRVEAPWLRVKGVDIGFRVEGLGLGSKVFGVSPYVKQRSPPLKRYQNSLGLSGNFTQHGGLCISVRTLHH